MKTVKKVKLTTESLGEMIEYVRSYENSFKTKVEKFRTRLAEEIRDNAEQSFSVSVVEDLINESPRMANVKMRIEPVGNVTMVIAEGEDAIFVEFGAGVYHNASVGGSLHPKGVELGFTIGSYGEGRGRQNAWYFKDKDGVHVTRGTPDTMPMYNAAHSTLEKIREIAGEVFG